jgi:hypothetical protein
MNTYSLAEIAAKALLHGAEGFSFSVKDGSEPIIGYMVSVPGAERKVAFHQRDRQRFYSWVREIAHYLERHASLLQRLPQAYLGGWVDGDVLYLDVSLCVPRLGAAVYFGTRWNQKAIYSVLDERVIALAPATDADAARAFLRYMDAKLATYSFTAWEQSSDVADRLLFGFTVPDAGARVSTLYYSV